MKKHELTEKKVFSYVEKHHMIAPGDRIVLGVSGGADSVCLLFLLLEYSKRVPFDLTVVHVNHGIRPDAGEDASYVRELCETHKLSFYLVKEDVQAKAQAEKCSEEDMGRRVRYEAFEKAAEEVDATKIAVAHNSDDNGETMLLHLFRGSGLGGLKGILPVRDMISESGADSEKKSNGSGLQLIRPILCLRRHEIEEYLKERGISWRKDSTNDSDDYTRNRIRHHILPYAEEYIASNVPDRMLYTAEIVQETEDYLEMQTKEALLNCLVTEDESKTAGRSFTLAGQSLESRTRYSIHRESFLKIHPALQKRILLQLAKQLSPTGKDISQVHVADMLTLFEQEGNRTIHLPFGIVARRQYDRVILEMTDMPMTVGIMMADRGSDELPDSIVNPEQDGIYDLGEWGKLEISHVFEEKYQELPRNQYTKWFDYDKINGYLEIRARRKGDYLTISDGAGGSRHKSLKDYMITEKIPRELRDRIPVLAVGNHVLWLVGYRISEDFKVRENTKHILQAKLIMKTQPEQKTEEENGRAD